MKINIAVILYIKIIGQMLCTMIIFLYTLLEMTDELYTINKHRGHYMDKTLQWHHNGHDSVSNHQPYDCLLKRLFRRKSKKTLKLRVTGLCAGNSPGTCEFPAQMASNAENVSIWWRHYDKTNDAQVDTFCNMVFVTGLMSIWRWWIDIGDTVLLRHNWCHACNRYVNCFRGL